MNMCLLLGTVLALQGPSPEAFVQRHVTLAVSVDYAKQQLSGAITYDLENWTSRSARSVSFLVNRLMEVRAVRTDRGRPVPFRQEVVRFVDDPKRQVTQAVVRLPRAIPAGGRITLRIDYAGYLTGYTEIGWLYVQDRIDTAFTIVREDALAFPVIGGISDHANRQRPRPDFTYDASVTVPAEYLVATGGAATRTTGENGTTTWHYTSGGASPFLNIAIARFDTLSADGIRIFYFRDDSAGARHLLADVQGGVAALTHWFGPQRAPLHLTITEIPNGWGSQANAVGGIIQTAAAFRDSTRVGELYHELSHLWNARDSESPPPRWNEGLAMFLQHLMRERLNGWTGREQYYQQLIVDMRTQLDSDSLLRTVPFIDYGKQRMTDKSYRVGDLMFATLYELLGEQQFAAALGGYYQQYAAGGTTREFTTFARKLAPELESFFNDWMYSTRWTERLAGVSSVTELAAPYRHTP